MIDRDETGDNTDPFRQLRYLPPPQTSQYHQTSQHLFHPQPIRQTVGPACLRQSRDPNGAIDSFSLRESLFGQGELNPGARHFTLESQNIHRTTPRFPPEYVNWRFGDPIPSNWRITVTPRAVNSPRPEQHCILMPDIGTPESYERCRDISLSSLLCPQPDRTVLEHAAILHHMRNSEPEFVTVGNPKIVSRPGSAREDTLMDCGDPHEQSSPRETTVPVTTNAPDDMFPFAMPAMGKEVILCEFEELATHTAKCDICNKHNYSGMSRCLTCGWQTCNPCTIARGYFRTHHVNGNIHTGPTSQNNLDATAKEISKAKKKSSPPKRKKGPMNARKSKKGHPAKNKTAKKVPRTPSKSSLVSNKVDADQEASAEEISDSGNRIKQSDPDTWDVDSILDDDATEYLPEDDQLEEEEASTWSPSNTPLSQGSLHNWNLQQAQRGHEIRRQKNIRSQKVKTSRETDADTPLTKSKASGQRTKAQAYCRKQPGRYSRL
ncbi:hypothetical protein F9C07_1234385 [Aspergillus flavus]|uniref:Uncharacterized protein n=3 Tax=Aspergillus subgen. Circumdati TaxID=2720871 RepID=A0A7G5JVU8_ASPFN|nr:unnamed protein product [Aspergillus oryzae RIB40]XP_041142672.1 uncharacterized protein G4B84_002958 [Aspergillus flavus NRRL3357]EIT73334.1 hypothetical protein Ao3042_10767 [Aspergillus oryzae 3.042]KDE78225.1 hypothetical protein AO1008_04385 [Aspergillus oryzae 100-8]QMW39740.1 hypothetical protein G4B11_003020 [Aspergillus flavus]KAF7619888.1 hypothetical protein AFLA_001507 [Aspergillus flavus NRRL3357]QMW27669.1 hypothetical protein G4B84_002958 [Aspergillus flavus NRRL3357]|eukprot:EIT73334.1 hypothetical protein Ao3042_10767 [Aspergillus oryzae 3.042]